MSSNSKPLPSSTVITPSLPTLSIASAIKSPISLFWAEIVATWAFSSFVEICFDKSFIESKAFCVAFSIPRRNIIGFVPAEIFFKPDSTSACANTVAVVVPSPATSFVLVEASFTSCAPIFSNLSVNSISFAIVTPSLTTWGAPQLLSKATFPPLGPRVVPTAFAKASTPFLSFCLASSPYIIIFAAIYFSPIN